MYEKIAVFYVFPLLRRITENHTLGRAKAASPFSVASSPFSVASSPFSVASTTFTRSLPTRIASMVDTKQSFYFLRRQLETLAVDTS